MKYAGMPAGMWLLFAGSFRKHLSSVFSYDQETARIVSAKAKPKYREIIGKLPEFEKADRFKMNIVNCAMLSAFVLSMKKKPSVEKLTDYYAKSMMTGPMRWFCRMSGKRKFSDKDIRGMKATASLNAADRNHRQKAVVGCGLQGHLPQSAHLCAGWRWPHSRYTGGRHRIGAALRRHLLVSQ